MTSFCIGSGAGYAGDRIDPAQDLAESGQLDVLVFECLAERTIALAQARRAADPNAGYDPLLQARLRAVLPACVKHGTQIITNMGAANPMAAGHAALAVAREMGLLRLRVAVITGDDVLPWMLDNNPPLMDGAGSVSGVRHAWVSANAYLGADALLPALAGGADLVITGRVADPALFLAPLMHRFGWAADNWAQLGQGVLVGHLLECAAQVSGGYLADPGVVDVPGLASVGFPLAHVQADGRAVISKLPGTGGRLDRLSVTAQLLYEIEDPQRYLQPDVTADFSTVTVQDLGDGRVAVHGAGGGPRPEHLKVSLGVREGFVGEGQISYGGPGARVRGELALQVLQHRLQRMGLADAPRRADLVGLTALYGRTAQGGTQGRQADEPAEVRLRLAVQTTTREDAERVAQEVEALYLNGPAAGGGVTLSVREVLAVASALIPREAVPTACHWLEV